METDSITMPRGISVTVEGLLSFIDPSAAKPSVRYGKIAPGETSASYAQHRVVIRDARTIRPRLDVEGFAVVTHRSAIDDYGDEAQIQTTGHEEAAALVANATGASRVHVFDHTLRNRSPSAHRQPSVRVHNDYTTASALQRVRELLGEEAASQPFAFINVWRPIRFPPADRPLALCDARSVAPQDLIATEIVYPDRRGENYSVAHNPNQRWYYVANMGLDEAVLIKCADMRPGVARFTPHTSFDNPIAPPGTPPRESIEYRTIALFPGDPVQLGRLR